MKRIILFLALMLGTLGAKAQDYEVWGTVKVTGKLSEKFMIAAEGENRYNFTQHTIRYFHYDLGFIYKLNDDWSIGGFYRGIYLNKDDFNSRVIIPHVDIFHRWDEFKFRARLEYILFEEIDLNDQFRLRLQPTWQSNFWNNFNPFVQTELFISEDKVFNRNRFNIGITIKLGSLQLQPGYVLESNLKNEEWIDRNIFWLNTKFKF